ncbi:hypothetical protein JCM3774_002132 [Rhodotorula dairenensis]
MPTRSISFKSVVDWTRGLSSQVPNTGSAARDHLAAERTVLAWLRTSMVLATVGIALAQLLRLPSTAFGSASTPTNQSAAADEADPTSLMPALDSLTSFAASVDPDLGPLVRLLAHQQSRLDALTQTRAPDYPVLAFVDESRYAHLAKPLGGTFLALGFVFVLLGIHRYYAVQHALMQEPSQFPPSRRSVGIGAVCIGALVLSGSGRWLREHELMHPVAILLAGALVIACFASVLANRTS